MFIFFKNNETMIKKAIELGMIKLRNEIFKFCDRSGIVFIRIKTVIQTKTYNAK